MVSWELTLQGFASAILQWCFLQNILLGCFLVKALFQCLGHPPEEISLTLYGDRDAKRETWKERKHISLTISYSSPSTTSPNIYTDHGLWYSDDENHKLRNNSNKTFKCAFILHMFFTLCFWINVPCRHDHRHQIPTFPLACCSEPPYLRSFPVVNINLNIS